MRFQAMTQRLKALVLIVLAMFFTQKLVSGTLYYYIGPRFSWLTITAVVLLIALASSYNLILKDDSDAHNETGHHDDPHDGHHHHHHESRRIPWMTLLIIASPVILGVVVPAQPLGASAVTNRGISTDITAAADVGDTILGIAPADRNVLDWVRMMTNDPAADALNGQEANVVGFVYRDIRFAEDQFMISRFTLSCCVADALAIGVVVEADSASDFPTDTWVQVEGTFMEGQLDTEALPIIQAKSVTPVEAPEQPYLFP